MESSLFGFRKEIFAVGRCSVWPLNRVLLPENEKVEVRFSINSFLFETTSRRGQELSAILKCVYLNE